MLNKIILLNVIIQFVSGQQPPWENNYPLSNIDVKTSYLEQPQWTNEASKAAPNTVDLQENIKKRPCPILRSQSPNMLPEDQWIPTYHLKSVQPINRRQNSNNSPEDYFVQIQNNPTQFQNSPLQPQNLPMQSQNGLLQSQSNPLQSQNTPLQSQYNPELPQSGPSQSEINPLQFRRTPSPIQYNSEHSPSNSIQSQFKPEDSQNKPFPSPEQSQNNPFPSQYNAEQSNSSPIQQQYNSEQPHYNAERSHDSHLQSQDNDEQLTNHPLQSFYSPEMSQVSPLQSQYNQEQSQSTTLQSQLLGNRNLIYGSRRNGATKPKSLLDCLIKSNQNEQMKIEPSAAPFDLESDSRAPQNSGNHETESFPLPVYKEHNVFTFNDPIEYPGHLASERRFMSGDMPEFQNYPSDHQKNNNVNVNNFPKNQFIPQKFSTIPQNRQNSAEIPFVEKHLQENLKSVPTQGYSNSGVNLKASSPLEPNVNDTETTEKDGSEEFSDKQMLRESDTEVYDQNRMGSSDLELRLREPAKGAGIIKLIDARLSVMDSSRVCYACSSISDITCWNPERKTTVKYCRKGRDSCVTKTYKTQDSAVVIRDCSTACDDNFPLLGKYESCSICASDMCNNQPAEVSGAPHLYAMNCVLIVALTWYII